MILAILLVLIVLLVCWLLFSVMELKIDTRIPQASFKWKSIGTIILVYKEDSWWLKLQVLFFRKEWPLQQFLLAKKKEKQPPKVIKKQRSKSIRWSRLFKLFKTFRVLQWQIAADTGNYVTNAQLYALNFYPQLRGHVVINFNEVNHFVFITRNSLWRMLYAWIK